jgi:hypothetical protein
MKKYTIKQGEHYSKHDFKLYLGKKDFEIIVKFTESCRYNLGDVDQLDINKLWGVSFGNHEKNSIRIGWAYNLFTDKIDLFYYTYENGIRKYEKISECFIGEIVTLELELNFNGGFWIRGTGITWESGQFHPYKYPFLKIGYWLYPYFGGNEVATHDIEIELEVK